jgi:hypothetical protein
VPVISGSSLQGSTLTFAAHGPFILAFHSEIGPTWSLTTPAGSIPFVAHTSVGPLWALSIPFRLARRTFPSLRKYP